MTAYDHIVNKQFSQLNVLAHSQDGSHFLNTNPDMNQLHIIAYTILGSN